MRLSVDGGVGRWMKLGGWVLVMGGWVGGIGVAGGRILHEMVGVSGAWDAVILLDAAECGDLEEVRAAIRRGADVNVVDEVGCTALIRAARSGVPGVVEVLLRAGARVEERSAVYGTALVAAARTGREGMVRRLLEAGADPRAEAGRGESALWGAVWCSAPLGTIEALLQAGADPNAADDSGRTPLDVAEEEGDWGTVWVLERWGAVGEGE